MHRVLKGITSWKVLIFVLLVTISYGHLPFMYVWQDDNAIFFKLAHMQDRAGYLGAGIFGEGVYKYTAFYYYPLYLLFGYQTAPYYIYTFVWYLLTTFVIYKVFSKIFSKSLGFIAGVIYASGYIASDGFIRFYNSVTTSLSIILLSTLILGLYKQYQKSNFKWYLVSLLSYFLTVEFAPSRTHYLIGAIVLYEVLFMFRYFRFKNILMFAARTIPFLVTFYHYFVQNADARSAGVSTLIVSILKGNLYNLYGFLTTVANTTIPDWLTRFTFNRIDHPGFIFLFLSILFVSYIFKSRTKVQKVIKYATLSLMIVWFFVYRNMLSSVYIAPDAYSILLFMLGGVVTMILICTFFFTKQKKRILFLIFLSIFFLNTAAYWAYFPLQVYESDNRYLAHSFFALIGLLVILIQSLKWSTFRKKVVISAVFLLAFGNAIYSFTWQNKIVTQRSIPPLNFYSQLQSFKPSIDKGDVFYFDVAKDNTGYFSDAFSVAQMPETTAIAWRYGVDRYDIQMTTSADQILSMLDTGQAITNQTYSYFYGPDGLVDTTSLFRKAITGDIDPSFVSPITPIRVSFEAKMTIPTPIVFPHIIGKLNAAIEPDKAMKIVAFMQLRQEFYSTADVSSDTEWTEREIENIHDANTDTPWQGHRGTWAEKHEESILIDLHSTKTVNSLVWQNWRSDLSPASYKIYSSNDLKDWNELSEIINKPRDNGEWVTDYFDQTQARYIKMQIFETLQNDSPAITEIMTLNIDKSIDPSFVQKFENDPSISFDNLQDWNNLSKYFYLIYKIQADWTTNKRLDTNHQIVSVIPDGNWHNYDFVIPAGGTQLSDINFIPNLESNLEIKGVTLEQLSLDELKNLSLIKRFSVN